MPSFDIVSEFDKHELTNAVDQANREVSTRFDFKGLNAKFEQEDEKIILTAEADFQLKQMRDILENKLVKRGVDIGFVKAEDPITVGKEAKQTVTLSSGIDSATAKSLVKMIKSSKIKVQAAIQGEKLRVTGKKRDDLQAVIQRVKDEKLSMPLQFENFRD